MLTSRFWTAALAGAAVIVVPVGADTYEFTFTGMTTSMSGSPFGDWGDVAVGQPVTVRYTFASDAPDQSAPANQGRFAILDYTLSIGTTSRTTHGQGQITKQLFSFVHAYYAISEWDAGDGALWRSTLALEDFLTDAWDGQTDALPLDLDIGDFPTRKIKLDYVDGARGQSFNIVASVDTFTSRIVPAPAAALALALGLTPWARRRRSA
ncbi:MAG: hypothetical protein KDA21_07815 [Phycisphaerales bacterium]|nr:hypothetical protein [Phycisphaerales bacterium]